MMRTLVLVMVMLASGVALGAEPATRKALPYSEKADALGEIDTALERAKQANQRVLLNVGGNWCGWCLRMFDLCTQKTQVAAVLKEHYQIVYVDAGRGERNRDIVALYDLKIKAYPHLAVLDADGNVLAQQDATVFEAFGAYDVEKIAAFLARWKAAGPAK